MNNNGNGNGSPDLICMRNIQKTYQMGSATVEALRGVDLTIREKEYIAIVGASAADTLPEVNIETRPLPYIRGGFNLYFGNLAVLV